jgi:SAM-dependent methyltransferase
MAVTTVPRVIPAQTGKPLLENLSELQTFARAVAVDGVWTADIARATAGIFDSMAATWNTEQSTNRFDPLHYAHRRGQIPFGGRCLEVGCGTGEIIPLLADHFDEVAAVDLSTAMLAEAPASVSFRICCDAGELARAVIAGGHIIWVNLLGQDGPLYVPAADIANALPGNWTSIESTAGWGSWAVLSAARAASASSTMLCCITAERPPAR